jgi:hypothetical protein
LDTPIDSNAKPMFISIFDIITDPQGVATRLDRKASWLYPLVVVSVGTFLIGVASLPVLTRILENSLPLGIPEEQARQTMQSILRYQKIGMFLIPLGLILKWLSAATLLLVSCLMLNINVGLKPLFALISQCSYITFLQELTAFLVIRIKGESVRSINDLSPQLGLDLFFTNLDKPLMFMLSYFSVFNIFYILALTVTLANLGKCSRLKAFIATIPNWVLPLIFGMGMLLLEEK